MNLCRIEILIAVAAFALCYLLLQGYNFNQKAFAHLYTHKTYEPSLASLSKHEAPMWWKDSKFGIFIHWGLYSVPGFAPTEYMWSERENVDNATWYKNHPYAEWYMNTYRIKGSPSREFHKKHFGKESYLDAFVPRFNQAISEWEPKNMAALFKSAGAKYAVLTSKHHDGFTLWPSNVPNPYRPAEYTHIERDLVGELGKAIKHSGMKYGLYYSGGLDWSFPGSLDGKCKDCSYRPQKPKDDEEYSNYATSHLYELMERYKPCILWNDINFPDYEKNERLYEVFAHFYSKVCPGHGIVNNRWQIKNGFNGDYLTPEYEVQDVVNSTQPWETIRGIGFSFGYNRNEGEKETMASVDIVKMLVDIVSKGGNLLLDVGPLPNGSISAIQERRLRDLGAWMAINSEGIYHTRPFLPDGAIPTGNFRYVRSKDYMALYVHVLDWDHSSFTNAVIEIPMKLKGFVIVEQFVTPTHKKELHQIQNGDKTEVHGVHFPEKKMPIVFRISTPKLLRKVVTITGF